MAGHKVTPESQEEASGAGGIATWRAEEIPQSAPAPQASVDATWREFATGDHWFRNLRIAHDGGFNEVHVLFTQDRFVWALFTVSFSVMNLWVLIYPNIAALATHEQWLVQIEVRRGYLINTLLQSIFGEGVNPRILLAILELTLLVVLICRASLFLTLSFSSDPAHRWHAIAQSFWLLVPHLMTFSSMRLLNFVAPSVFIPALSSEIEAARRRNFRRYGLGILSFTLLRVLCAIVGFEAFMIKFLDTAESVMHNQDSGWSAFFLSVAFLNQMLGIVQISPLVQQRLFVYIFGGEDSFLSDREKAIQAVWCARLAKHIWEEAVKRPLAVPWFVAVMLAYTDIDFQRLTLNEKSKKQKPQEVSCETAGDGSAGLSRRQEPEPPAALPAVVAGGRAETDGDSWVLKAA